MATAELVAIEAGGLAPVIPTARAAALTMDRERIRALAAENRTPTSPYALPRSRESTAQRLTRMGFPCLVKPVMTRPGRASAFATRASADVADAWARHWRQPVRGRRDRRGAVAFDYEITLLTVRARHDTLSAQPMGHRPDATATMSRAGSRSPCRAVALRECRRIAAKVTGALGGRGIFGVELFVKGDAVLFSEVSPRPHDTGMVTLFRRPSVRAARPGDPGTAHRANPSTRTERVVRRPRRREQRRPPLRD